MLIRAGYYIKLCYGIKHQVNLNGVIKSQNVERFFRNDTYLSYDAMTKDKAQSR